MAWFEACRQASMRTGATANLDGRDELIRCLFRCAVVGFRSSCLRYMEPRVKKVRLGLLRKRQRSVALVWRPGFDDVVQNNASLDNLAADVFAELDLGAVRRPHRKPKPDIRRVIHSATATCDNKRLG